MSKDDDFCSGDFLIMGIPGKVLDQETRKAIEEVQPSGFILFSRNIKDPQQLRDLMDDLRQSVEHEPILTIDQEGGRVSRLREMGAEPPSAQELRIQGEPSLISQHGELTGKLLRLFGFNLNLAPVLDISFDDEADNSLKNRCWGKSPQEVVEKARLFTEGMRSEGVLSCGKHFPGYSRLGSDPHHELSMVEQSRQELEACEWIPFQQLIPHLDAMMMGHVVYPHLDATGSPASLSRPIIEGILRQEWGYKGLVISDDVDMGALMNYCDFATSLQRAVEAGTDLILLCHRVSLVREAAKALAQLPEEVKAASRQRIQSLRKRLVPPPAFSIKKHAELDKEVSHLRVATLGEASRGQRSPEDGKRSPVELY